MKPILFNTEMVRVILDGRKTTTRRIIKPQCRRNFIGTGIDGKPAECRMIDIDTQKIVRHAIPPFQPGDVLYVRETWMPETEQGNSIGSYLYKASDKPEPDGDYPLKWHPSIHMPKEAARIFLKVADVKAERLQEIDKLWRNYDREGMRNPKFESIGIWMQEKFISIWNSTVKKSDLDRYGWAANPWVWVISFERCEKPGDGS